MFISLLKNLWVQLIFFVDNMSAQASTIILQWGLSVVFVVILCISVGELLRQYACTVCKCEFSNVREIIYTIYVVHYAHIYILMSFLYIFYLSCIIGVNLTHNICIWMENGWQEWAGYAWNWNGDLNMLDIGAQGYITKYGRTGTESIKENSMNIIKEGGKIIQSVQPLYARVNYFQQNLEHTLDHNSYINSYIKTCIKNKTKGEAEQCLTTIEYANKLLNKYMVCPIGQINQSGSADALLVDANDSKTYLRIQYKIFSGNLANKNIVDYINKYNTTTDVLDITLNPTITNFETFFYYLHKNYMESKIPFNIYLHSYNPNFDALALEYGIKNTEAYLGKNVSKILDCYYSDIQRQVPMEPKFFGNWAQLTQNTEKNLLYNTWWVKKYTPLELE